jgi:hypothetical protein
LYALFVRRLSSPGVSWQVALLALVMSLPAVTMGLVADDYELALAVTRDPWSAYTFYDDKQAVLDARARGMAPWWIDSELRQRFFRPLSSLSLALDFRIFPDSALPLHVENSILYAVIVLIVAALYRALDFSAAHLGIATRREVPSGAISRGGCGSVPPVRARDRGSTYSLDYQAGAEQRTQSSCRAMVVTLFAKSRSKPASELSGPKAFRGSSDELDSELSHAFAQARRMFAEGLGEAWRQQVRD